jgi:hypothetical protein
MTLVKICAEEPADLRRDVVDDFPRDLLLRQCRTGQLDELPPEHLVGEQHEVGQKQNHDQLVDRADRADRSGPQETGGRDSGLFHLHAHHARRWFRLVCLRKLLGSLLDLVEGTRVRPGPSLDERRNTARARRQLVDDRQRLVLEGIRAAQDRAHRQAKCQCRREPPGHPDAFHGIDGRIERVEEEESECERREKRLRSETHMPSAMTMSATLCASSPSNGHTWTSGPLCSHRTSTDVASSYGSVSRTEVSNTCLGIFAAAIGWQPTVAHVLPPGAMLCAFLRPAAARAQAMARGAPPASRCAVRSACARSGPGAANPVCVVVWAFA